MTPTDQRGYDPNPYGMSVFGDYFIAEEDGRKYFSYAKIIAMIEEFDRAQYEAEPRFVRWATKADMDRKIRVVEKVA